MVMAMIVWMIVMVMIMAVIVMDMLGLLALICKPIHELNSYRVGLVHVLQYLCELREMRHTPLLEYLNSSVQLRHKAKHIVLKTS